MASHKHAGEVPLWVLPMSIYGSAQRFGRGVAWYHRASPQDARCAPAAPAGKIPPTAPDDASDTTTVVGHTF